MDKLPVVGEVYVCKECGMELTVTKDCKCMDPVCVCLECCEMKMILKSK